MPERRARNRHKASTPGLFGFGPTKTWSAPIFTLYVAIFSIKGDGVLGRSGTPIASWFMNECDLIIAIGASFSHHTGMEPSKPNVQIDFDRMHLGKGHAVAAALWGEIRETFPKLRNELIAQGLGGANAVMPVDVGNNTYSFGR